MIKKIFALVMVVSVLGVVLGGCAKAEEAETPAATAGTAGTTTA
jgi:hypothetical protein